ncbi:DNA topoisomerase IB [Aquimarina sp. ERC-38]|uniref:DNA topoisomerase IB n=1 Tax=Aquimarina sp. ERC-38 TaxID=2949996 RepID=UPI002248739D|nr:DNA topoisomerase IB [Aquimarina sp. ERC-38]UZO81108.1 DNA topoisomerase IB [Aquimarina sp. ERC-38]
MNTSVINNPKFIKKLITHPEEVIDQLDLIYVNDDKLSILRKKKDDDFEYYFNGKKLSKSNDLDRIKSLVIPPAWTNVRIAALNNGHLQAVGRDLKNRKQYRYHPMWSKIRNQTKFFKMTAFGKKLPNIREQVDQDLQLPGFPKNKILALIIRLMEETHIRIGNEQYAKRNKTYGLSTLRTRHVTLMKNKMKFEFVGKKGKKHSISLKNKKLVKLVNKCEEIPGWELFQYYDEEGEKHSVESGMINEYIHDISGDLFTAKDFRTWAATVVFFNAVLELGITGNEKEAHKNALIGFDTAAKELGNTRNVCRKYYVHPHVVNSYMNGSIATYFDKHDQLTQTEPNFTVTETIILEMLSSYTPEFLK